MRYNFLTSSQIIRRITMAISSVNFQKTKPNSVAETTREFEAKYLLKKEYRQENSYWNCGKSDREIYNEQRAIYDEAKKGRGKRPSYENCVWEAVVNFNADHTLEDMKKVAEHIAKKFNIIPTRIAMHRDEGHLNSSGEVVYNYHAHLNFVTLKDAQQNWTVSKTKNKLSDLQTEVAEILGMERGKFKSEAKRLDHKQYRVEAKAREQRTQEQDKLKAELEAVKLSKKEIKEQFEAFRKENAGQGLSKEFFKELSDEKKKQLQEPSYTQDELKAYFTELLEKHTSKKKGLFSEKEVIDYEKIIQEQQQTISDLNAKNDNLKQIANKTIEFIDQKVKIDLNAKFDLLKQQNEIQLNEQLKKRKNELEYELIQEKNQVAIEKINLQNQIDRTVEAEKKAKQKEQDYIYRRQELTQSSLIQELTSSYEARLKAEREKQAKLEEQNENLKLDNERIRTLNEFATEMREKAEQELKEIKKQLQNITEAIERAVKGSWQIVYDRSAYGFKSAHIKLKEFFSKEPQEQERIINSNIQAHKDIEQEKQEKNIEREKKSNLDRRFKM